MVSLRALVRWAVRWRIDPAGSAAEEWVAGWVVSAEGNLGVFGSIEGEVQLGLSGGTGGREDRVRRGLVGEGSAGGGGSWGAEDAFDRISRQDRP